MTTMTAPVTGHPEECICVPCMMVDMDQALTAQGLDPMKYRDPSDGATTATRMRYAQPGAQCGTGIVRLVSPKQVSFIKRLMIDRDTTNLVRLPGSENIEKMSLRGACDLIERLLACPEKPAGARPVRMASEKAIAFMLSLAERKGFTNLPTGTDRTPENVSKTIELLKGLPSSTVPAAETLTEGLYQTDGKLYRLKYTRSSGQLVAYLWDLFETPESTAKGLKYGEFVYQGKAPLRSLTLEMRMTLAEAQAHGVEFHYCCACGIELTNPESIELGIGPICRSKF